MRDGRRNVRSLVLGPRALAVISCALALLAAQPGARGGEFRVQNSEFRMKGEGLRVAALDSSRVKIGRERRQAILQKGEEPVKVAAARGFHVLAGVEILQRLLAFELRPMERQVVPALLFEPVCVLLFEAPLSPAYRVGAADGGCVSVEREFALARLLLAPPGA